MIKVYISYNFYLLIALGFASTGSPRLGVSVKWATWESGTYQRRHGEPVGYFQKRYWGNISRGTCPPPYVSKITISLSPTLRIGPGMNRVFWGPAWWYLFAKGKVTGLQNLNLQGFRFIAFALPSNVEAIYHHKSMGPVPDKWLLRVIKRSASATLHKCTVEKIRSLIFQTLDSSEKCLSWL